MPTATPTRTASRGAPVVTGAVVVALVVLVGAVTVQRDSPLALVLLASGVAAAWWLALCGWRPALAVVCVVAVVCSSAHVLALAFSAGVPAGVVRDAILVKDAMAWSLLAVLCLRAILGGQRLAPLAALAMFGLVAGVFLLTGSPAPAVVQLQSLRGVLVPVLGLALGALLTDAERRRAAVLSVYVIAASAVYALVELAMPRRVVSESIGVGLYWLQVKEVGEFVDPVTLLPGNFFTSGGFPRLSGAFGDPLAAGVVLASGLVLAVVHRRALRGGAVVLAVLSVALLLTFTRNGWILALLGVGTTWLVQRGLVGAAARFAPLAVVLAALVVAVAPVRDYAARVLSGEDGSTLGHQEALAATLGSSYSLTGSGWGTGGSLAQNTFAEAVTSESSYVAVLVQVGWLGLALLLAALGLLARSVAVGSPQRAVVAAVVVSQAVSALVSENALTFNAGLLPFLALGLVASAPSSGTAEDVGSRRRRIRGDREGSLTGPMPVPT